jgi:hypothetical protein
VTRVSHEELGADGTLLSSHGGESDLASVLRNWIMTKEAPV